MHSFEKLGIKTREDLKLGVSGALENRFIPFGKKSGYYFQVFLGGWSLIEVLTHKYVKKGRIIAPKD